MAADARKRFAQIVETKGGHVVAEGLGVSVSHVSRIKDGNRLPSGTVAARIERLYKIPAAAWF